METPLNAREFLKRFHLPQLVRISTKIEEEEEEEERDDEVTVNQRWQRNSNTCQSSGTQHERSDDWTYKPAADADEFRSLMAGARVESPDQSQFHHSISNWSPGNAELPPGASLHQHQVDARRKSVPNSVEAELKQQPEATLEGKSIRLMPASKRPAQSKLELKQPFLLYKAYKKLELCAYSIDPNNQLNEKSGDPIYYPQNYPGWFSLGNHQHRPFASIDQVVCMAGYSQIFLTRDELIAYQLPAKLSHLTKLKNNQLLALPLAINLAASQQSSCGGGAKSIANQQNDHHLNADKDKHKHKDRDKTKGSSSSASASDLKRIAIRPGQVLKICGIYEDVMPLIGANQHLKIKPLAHDARPQDNRQNKKKMPPPQQPMALQQFNQPHYPHQSALDHSLLHQHQHQQMVYDPHCMHPCKQVTYQAPPFEQQTYGGGGDGKPLQANINGYNKSKTTHLSSNSDETEASSLQQRLLRLNLKAGSKAATVRELPRRHQRGAIYGQQPVATSGMTISRPAGQRYARCMVLSQHAVDRMVTNSRLVEPSSSTGLEPSLVAFAKIGTDDPEPLEVLIPIEQVGRFYLCASTGSDLLRASSSSDFRSRLVFRLSQVISLLSLSRKLMASCHEDTCCGRPANSNSNVTAGGIRLPLIVELVIGPRPINFSPSMFGTSSSSMESYFSQERNIGGHSIGCQYHKTYQEGAASMNQHRLTQGDLNKPVCSCWMASFDGTGTTSGGNALGLMSGLMRIERIAKRDVLLACTIKLDPLEHLKLDYAHNKPESQSGISLVGGRRLHDSNCVSGRLMALRESTTTTAGARDQQQQQQQQQELSSKGLLLFGSKPSFSRLRACRSLISLHGRRQKKQRPNIPMSMMQAADQRKPPATTLHSGSNPGAGSDKSEFSFSTTHQKGGCELIVMVEFDCSDTELGFVRTFVDSSLPTSTIPDLVLNRIEYCNRNSSDWERQLKLSHLTLSHDFDCYKQQLIEQQQRQQRRRLLQTCNRQTSPSVMFLSNQDVDLNHFNARQQQVKQQLKPCSRQHSNEEGAARRQGVPAGPGVAAGDDSGATCADSTASSRSSSGVSSSGDRKKHCPSSSSASSSSKSNSGRRHSSQRSNSLIILDHRDPHLAHIMGAPSSVSSSPPSSSTSTSTSTSTAAPSTSGQRLAAAKHHQAAVSSLTSLAVSCNTITSTATSSAVSLAAPAVSSSTSYSPPGRLLRLVNKILPGRTAMAAGDKQQQQQQQQKPARLIEDGRQSKQAVETKSTLMNSQKLHKRLLGAAATTASEGGLLGEEERHRAATENMVMRRKHDDDDDEDESGSHLYESLEKISEQMQEHQPSRDHHFRRRAIDGIVRAGENDEEEEEEEEDDDWWADDVSSSHSTMQGENWRTTKTREEDSMVLPGGASMRFSGLPMRDSNTMEPVSIEAIEEVLVNDDDDDDDDRDFVTSFEENHKRAFEPRVRHHRSNPILIEENRSSAGADDHRESQQQRRRRQNKNVYVNLQQSRSNFELDKKQQAQTRTTIEQPSSRMERKLLKIRGRRSFVVSGQCWPTGDPSRMPAITKDVVGGRQFELFEENNDNGQEEAGMRSIMPIGGSNESRRKPSHCRRPTARQALRNDGDLSKRQLVRSFVGLRSLSVGEEQDDSRAAAAISMLSLSDHIEGAPRDGASNGRDSSGGGQVKAAPSNGAVNSLRSEESASLSATSSAASSSSSSTIASDDRHATGNSSHYSSSSSSSFGMDGSCKSSSADWSSLLVSDRRQCGRRRRPASQVTGRVGQVTGEPSRGSQASQRPPSKASVASNVARGRAPDWPTTCRARQ